MPSDATPADAGVEESRAGDVRAALGDSHALAADAALLGVLCFVLGGIGAVVPGLPTTVFLLVGSFFLTRNCPWLEEDVCGSDSSALREFHSLVAAHVAQDAAYGVDLHVDVDSCLDGGAGCDWKLTLILAGTIFAAGLFGTVVITGTSADRRDIVVPPTAALRGRWSDIRYSQSRT